MLVFQRRNFGLVDVVLVLRDADRRQNADNGDHDQKLDQ